MTSALERLAEFSGDATIADRDPHSPLSFSLITPEEEKETLERIYTYARGQRDAFSPLRPDGWPIRRYVSLLMFTVHQAYRVLNQFLRAVET
jgi:DNA-nicking Smr family endonuclease